MKEINDIMLQRVVERFRALGDAGRLRMLMRLQQGECAVGAMAEHLGMGQASVSKHLDRLKQCGLVASRREGNQVWYRLRDHSINQLCDLMCGAVRSYLGEEQQALSD